MLIKKIYPKIFHVFLNKVRDLEVYALLQFSERDFFLRILNSSQVIDAPYIMAQFYVLHRVKNLNDNLFPFCIQFICMYFYTFRLIIYVTMSMMLIVYV